MNEQPRKVTRKAVVPGEDSGWRTVEGAPPPSSLHDALAAAEHEDAATVNAHLLHVSTHHWEEAAYWFPSLKRLVKL